MWTYITAPQDTAKGVIRGIPLSETLEEFHAKIFNRNNPLALGAKRNGTTTTVTVVFDGTRLPNYVRYESLLLKCSLYCKKIDVCNQCGRVGHRRDVCPNPNERRCPGCDKPNPATDHSCTPRCKLCGGDHVTGDRVCKARFKTTYVVRRRQWERRIAVEEDRHQQQLPLDLDFPALQPTSNKPRRSLSRERAESRGRSPSRESILRNKSRSPSATRRGMSPSRERVSWADRATGVVAKSGEKATRRQRSKKPEEESDAIAALRNENKELRNALEELRTELKSLRLSQNVLASPTDTSSIQPQMEEMNTPRPQMAQMNNDS